MTAPRLRSPLVALLAILALGITSSPLPAQVELNAAERRQRLERIEVSDELVARVILPEQQLVVWLPERFEPCKPISTLRVFCEREHPTTTVTFSRHAAPPGLGLIHAWELTEEKLREDGFLKQVESLRQVKIAGRPALEVVALTEKDEQALSSRLVLAFDPDQRFLSELVVHCAEGEEDRADALFKGLMRDWTPVDQGLWDSGFESLRSRLIAVEAATGIESLPWAERNRLLAAISKPSAIAQPWVGLKLLALAGDRPVLLIDGLLHHHPRVRIACLEALGAIAGDPAVKPQVLALALRDRDPIVRFTGARLAADELELATDVLRHLLAVDHERARSGAFQLVALVDDEHRRQLVSDAFAERDQYPVSSQALLACLLGEWGPESADRVLLSAWKRATENELRYAAFGELLRREHPEILVHARHRLADPSQQDPLSVDEAVRYLIAESAAGTEVGPLHKLVGGLESAVGEGENGAADRLGEEQRGEWTEAAEQLRRFAEHLQGLPDGVTAEEECRIVAERLLDDPDLRWVRRRSAGLGCTESGAASDAVRLLRIELPQPGSLLLGMRDLLDRLELKSQEEDRFYHSLLDRIFESVEDSLADPISAESTGLDLVTAWRGQGWGSTGSKSDMTDSEPDISVTVQCTDPERFLHQLVRSATGSMPLAEVFRTGVVVSAMLPLLPAMLAEIWDQQRQIVLGKDSDETPEPSEAYLALVAHDLAEAGKLWKLRRLEQYRKKPPSWSTVLSARIDGHRVTLLPLWSQEKIELAEPEVLAAQQAPDDWDLAADAAGEVVLDVDLATMLRLEPPASDKAWMQPLLDAGLRMNAAFGFDGSELATSFSLSGLPGKWLEVTRNRAVGELRAPVELLGAGTLIWTGVSLDPERLAEVLRREAESWTSDLDEVDPEHLLELAGAVGSEIGLAVVGLPEAAEEVADAWLDRLLVYILVEPRAAQRFLKSAMAESRRVHGKTIYRQGSLRAARFGDFLVLAGNDQLLAELDAGPRLATTTLYDEMLARSPAEVAMVAVLHVDLFAQSLIERIPPDSDKPMTRLVVELLSAFGPIVAWCGQQGDRIEGRISLRPNLLSEAARERARRLVGYVGYTSGSIPIDGFATGLEAESIARVELDLELADPGWSLSAADAQEHCSAAGDRLQLRPAAPGIFELVSHAAVALPENSRFSLPIEGEQLAPYLRSERGLGLREREISELAREIRAGENDPARIIRAVIEWVGENLEYQSVAGTESTEETLASRQADCTEFTHLTIALCRSLGIPARAITGAALGDRVAILHRWAEVYLDRWYEIDPTNGWTQVPAGSVRLPVKDARTLATTPGNRLRLQAVRARDGGLARRLIGVEGGRLDDRIEIAVSEDQVLVAHAATQHDGASEGYRLLLSGDRGDRFTSVATGAGLGDLLDLVGGHGQLLWLGRGGDGHTQLHALSGVDTWNDLTTKLRQQLSRGLGAEPGSWSMATVAEGFLVLVAGDPPRAALLSPQFDFLRQLPLPHGLGDPWVLGHDRPLMAHRTLDGGVALIEWQGQEWATLVDFSDAAGLVPRRLRTAGARVEVVCHDPERDRGTVLWWSASTGKHNRVTPKGGVPVGDSVTVDGWMWKAWREGSGLVFSRRPRNTVAPL